MSVNSSLTREFDALATHTQDHFRNKMIDNIFVGVPFLEWLRGAGKVERVPGGIQIVEQLMYGTNSTGQSVTAYTPIDLTPQEGYTVARYNWRAYTISTILSRFEKNQNSGSEEQLINLWMSKLKQTELSLIDLLATDAIGAQAGNGLDGLETIIGLSAGTVGTLSETDNPWWAPYRDTSGITTATMKADLRKAFNEVGKQLATDKPDLVLMGQDMHEAYEGTFESIAQFMLNAQNAKDNAGWGVGSLYYKSVPVVWDSKMTVDRAYILNSKYLKFVIHSTDGDFKMSPVRSPIDQNVSVSDIWFMGNLITNKRSALGLLDNWTAS